MPVLETGACNGRASSTLANGMYGSVAELADAPDLSPGVFRNVWVRVPPELLYAIVVGIGIHSRLKPGGLTA